MAKDYAAIAASKIRKPSSMDKVPSVLVYARNKKGKTRFCSTAPNVLVLDPEVGTSEEKKLDPDTYPIVQWEDMAEVTEFLRTRPKSPLTGQPYEWLAVDGMTRITNMSLRWVMKQAEERDLTRQPGQVGKQDYGRSGEMVKSMLHTLETLPLKGIVYTAQERMFTVEDEGADSADEDAPDAQTLYVPDLPKGARGALNSVVGVIGRLYTLPGERKVRLKDGTIEERPYVQRRLWLDPHVQYDTGYRSQFTLPPYLIDPTVPKLVNLIRQGKARTDG